MTETLDVDSLPPPETIRKPDHTKSREGGTRRAVRAVRKTASSEPKEPTPKTKPGQFVEPVEQIYTGLALTLMPFDEQCATVIMENGNRCATAWDDLAQRNDAVRKALVMLTETSAWGTLLIAHAPVLLAVAGHHMPGRKPVEAETVEETDTASQNGWVREPAR